MARILLVRHGETEWNRIKRVMGHLHIPLNDKGVQQVTILADMLKTFPLSAVYASPLQRTMQTAQIIADFHSLSVKEEQNIIEVDFGKWVGKHYDELREDPVYKQFYRIPKDTEIPGGEAITAVQKRGVSAVEQASDRHGEGLVVMVSHCDVIRLILTYCAQSDINSYRVFNIENASLSVVSFNTAKPSILFTNYLCDKKHLKISIL